MASNMVSSSLSFLASFLYGSENSFSGFTSKDIQNVDHDQSMDGQEGRGENKELKVAAAGSISQKSNMADPVSHYARAHPNKGSVTITLSSNIVDKVKQYLDDELTFVKGDIQNGLIYKTSSQTITLYTTTTRLHVQGMGYQSWVESFLKLSVEELTIMHQTSVKVTGSQPLMASTPAQNNPVQRGEKQNDLEDPDLSDIVQLTTTTQNSVVTTINNDPMCELQTNEEVDCQSDTNHHLECHQVIKQLRERINELEGQINSMKSNSNSVSTATQTPPPVPKRLSKQQISSGTSTPVVETVNVMTQTNQISNPNQTTPAEKRNRPGEALCKTTAVTVSLPETNNFAGLHSLSYVSDDELPNDSHALPERLACKNDSTKDHTQQKAIKTLIIGSSILKGVKTRGLKSTVIRTHRGARVNTIREEIHKMDLRPYRNIVLQVGGNDISSGRRLSDIERDYEALIFDIRERTKWSTNIYVSGIPPRSDADVFPLNDMLLDLCEYNNIVYITQDRFFVESNGNLCPRYYHRDGIHLTNKGTVCLLTNIDKVVPIMRNSQQEAYCRKCGEDNHFTDKCRYNRPVRCNTCQRDGHKMKFCGLYN